MASVYGKANAKPNASVYLINETKKPSKKYDVKTMTKSVKMIYFRASAQTVKNRTWKLHSEALRTYPK